MLGLQILLINLIILTELLSVVFVGLLSKTTQIRNRINNDSVTKTVNKLLTIIQLD